MKYGYTRKNTASFEDVVTKTKEALQDEGFGILTEIDVQATLKKKLDVDFDHYLILGACNPPFAYQALQAEQEVGLLLPCNVIVYEKNGECFVSTMLPTVAMRVVDNDALAEIAKQVEIKLIRAIDNV